MPVMPNYIKAHLMTERAMKLYELMHEEQSPRVLNAKALIWRVDGGVLGWLERQLRFLADKRDHNRKV